MAYQVLKFPIPPASESIFTIPLPKEAKFAHFAIQNGEFQAWFLCDMEAPKEKTPFMCVGTGWPISEMICPIPLGTLFSNGFVWHLLKVGGQ